MTKLKTEIEKSAGEKSMKLLCMRVFEFCLLEFFFFVVHCTLKYYILYSAHDNKWNF